MHFPCARTFVRVEVSPQKVMWSMNKSVKFGRLKTLRVTRIV